MLEGIQQLVSGEEGLPARVSLRAGAGGPCPATEPHSLLLCWAKELGIRNQAKKSIGRMPRHQAPKKDVASCEKLRGAASGQRTVDIRMGEPGGRKVRHAEMNT